MNIIQIEEDINKLMLIRLDTITNLFSYKNGADLVSLYMFYYKQCKIQKTNQSLTVTEFVKKGLGWGDKKFKDAKIILKELNLIEDIITRNEKGIITGNYIKVNFIESLKEANLSIGAETRTPDTPGSGYQEINAGSNKDKMLEVIKDKESTNTLADSIPPVNVKEYIEPSLDKDISSSITPVNVKKINSGEAEEVCNYYKTQFLKKKGHNNKLATQRINTLLEKYTKQEIINAVDEYKKSKKETIQKDEWQFIKTTDTFFGFEKGTKIHFIERFITQEKKADIKQAKPTTTVIDHNWLNDF